MEVPHCSQYLSHCGGTQRGGSCNPAGTRWRLPLGWATTAAPLSSLSRCSCWRWREPSRELQEHNEKTIWRCQSVWLEALWCAWMCVWEPYVLLWNKTGCSHRCFHCCWDASGCRCSCSVVSAGWGCIACKASEVLCVWNIKWFLTDRWK